MGNITFEDIKQNSEFKTYIQKADELLSTLGFTEHSFIHAGRVANTTEYILSSLGYSKREVELAKIAAYIHDIGNMVNRVEHAQTGAVLAFNILSRIGMKPEEISTVISAIGNHDEGSGNPVNLASAALILADKSDVRNTDFATFDIHDRVNYAVEQAQVKVDHEKRVILLEMNIDVEISSLMEYFEIFLNRMMMCRKAANFLDAKFELVMNGTKLL